MRVASRRRANVLSRIDCPIVTVPAVMFSGLAWASVRFLNLF